MIQGGARKLRFTPAYAGKIDIDHICWVHPRIRGEDLGGLDWRELDQGSPPHTRGRSALDGKIPEGAGFTPAYAGKI